MSSPVAPWKMPFRSPAGRPSTLACSPSSSATPTRTPPGSSTTPRGRATVLPIVRYGPVAARAAAAGGAHREASGIYRLLVHGGEKDFGPAERAEFLEQAAIECYLIGDEDRCSAGHLRAAVALRREQGDPLALGSSLRWLSRALWWNGDRCGAEAAAAESTAVLHGAGRRSTAGHGVQQRGTAGHAGRPHTGGGRGGGAEHRPGSPCRAMRRCCRTR